MWQSMQTQLPKHVYYKDEDLIFEYQEYKGNIFLHCNFTNWRLSSAKRFYSVLHTFLEEAKKNESIHTIMSISPNPKFCHMYGGTTVKTINYEGKDYEVVKWE